MNQSLQEVARSLAVPGKGVLAADESNSTAKKRLESVGVADSEENRRAYRELFLAADEIEEYLAGVILYDETFWQETSDGVSFVKLLQDRGIHPGIKVDMSTAPLPNFPDEVFTQGLDGLAERLAQYAEAGATFTKWRTVVRVSEKLPTATSLAAQSHSQAHYAAAAQAAGLVPIVEPEVLYEGDHLLTRAEDVTTRTLRRLFEELQNYKVQLDAVVLKSSMVLAGKEHAKQSTPEEVAEATLRTFQNAVPAEVPSIVFLSGGQTAQQATANLQAIAEQKAHAAGDNTLPWQISFSYARALQGPALEVWQGKSENVAEAQRVFLQRLKETAAARDGKL